MGRIIYTENFLGDMLQVRSTRVEDAIFDAIDLLPHVPALGSHRLPASIERRYGANARKIAIAPFDIIYATTDDGDFVILGLVHMRSAR